MLGVHLFFSTHGHGEDPDMNETIIIHLQVE